MTSQEEALLAMAADDQRAEAEYVQAAEEAQDAIVTQTLVIRHTGEVIDVTTPEGCVAGLEAIQEITTALHDLRSDIVTALIDHRRQRGSSTFPNHAGTKKVELGPDEERVVDATKLREGLVAADAPEDLISEIIRQTVTEKVDLRRADRAASHNPAYAEALAEATTYRACRVTARLASR